MIALSMIGGLLVGNGLSALWLGKGLFSHNISTLEVVVGGLVLLVRAFQLGRESR